MGVGSLVWREGKQKIARTGNLVEVEHWGGKMVAAFRGEVVNMPLPTPRNLK